MSILGVSTTDPLCRHARSAADHNPRSIFPPSPWCYLTIPGVTSSQILRPRDPWPINGVACLLCRPSRIISVTAAIRISDLDLNNLVSSPEMSTHLHRYGPQSPGCGGSPRGEVVCRHHRYLRFLPLLFVLIVMTEVLGAMLTTIWDISVKFLSISPRDP